MTVLWENLAKSKYASDTACKRLTAYSNPSPLVSTFVQRVQHIMCAMKRNQICNIVIKQIHVKRMWQRIITIFAWQTQHIAFIQLRINWWNFDILRIHKICFITIYCYLTEFYDPVVVFFFVLFFVHVQISVKHVLYYIWSIFCTSSSSSSCSSSVNSHTHAYNNIEWMCLMCQLGSGDDAKLKHKSTIDSANDKEPDKIL